MRRIEPAIHAVHAVAEVHVEQLVLQAVQALEDRKNPEAQTVQVALVTGHSAQFATVQDSAHDTTGPFPLSHLH